MQTTLTIKDETTSNLGVANFVISIPLTTQRFTARDLIRERVKKEVEDFNIKQPELFHGLVQPKDAERTPNGFKLRKPRQLDWREEFDKAIEGFHQNAFVLLVNDSQVEDLDQVIPLSPETSVTFLKLVPLVGG